MSKKNKLTLEQEASVLHYLEYTRGKQLKGVNRTYLYEVYNMFSSDGRSEKTCSCLDRDTHKKVDNFINTIEWSEWTKSSEKMKQVLPNQYVEAIEYEEEQTQPVEIDLDKLSKAIEKRKAKAVPVKAVKKSKVKKK
tara:strand:+ start:286 stop:696 length:411 start_codon:yes stop_codon:yes gene_type:complete